MLLATRRHHIRGWGLEGLMSQRRAAKQLQIRKLDQLGMRRAAKGQCRGDNVASSRIGCTAIATEHGLANKRIG